MGFSSSKSEIFIQCTVDVRLWLCAFPNEVTYLYIGKGYYCEFCVRNRRAKHLCADFFDHNLIETSTCVCFENGAKKN